MEETTRISSAHHHRHAQLRHALAVQLCITGVMLVYALLLYLNASRWHERSSFQFFTERDPTLSYPQMASTVPEWVRGIIVTGIPTLAIVAANLMRWRMQSTGSGSSVAAGVAGAGGEGGRDALIAEILASSSATFATSGSNKHEDAGSTSTLAIAPASTVVSRSNTITSEQRMEIDDVLRRTTVVFFVCVFELFGMIQAILLTIGIDYSLKCCVGRLGPNFFAACNYKGRKGVTIVGELTTEFWAVG